MSDTDDTDLLLLVPPDFFAVHSPRCVSPSDYFDVEFESSQTGRYSMERECIEPSHFKYRSSQLMYSNTRNNEFSPASYSNFSANKTDFNKIGISSSKSEDYFQNNFYKYRNKTSDTASLSEHDNTADNFIREKITNKISENHAKEDTPRSPKFSLKQVDKLLNEMEKTRAEIKSKLQTNKNKIHEMRREYTSNNIINESFNRNMIVTSPAKNEVSNVRKSIENIKESSSVSKPLNTNIDVQIPSESKNVLHLTKIMSKDNDFETIRQKLEAEIMKKNHCEEVIQQLQSNLLEYQQNINVALKVDAQKDEIIGQLQQSWTQLVEHWKELEYQRQDLASMLERERVESTKAKASFEKKSEQLETRLLEAVRLANGYQDKNEKLEKTLNEAQESLRKNHQYVETLENEKIEYHQQLEQTINVLRDEKEKNSFSESKISDLEARLSSLTCEKNELVKKYENEKNLVDRLQSEIVKLKLNYTRANNSEHAAQKEASNLKNEMTRMKNSLKEFYQKQLETVLKVKVNEFQKELDKAQALMQIELRKQEKSAEQSLQTEIHQLKESYKLELSEERRLNQKHVNILKNELKESRKRAYELQNRIKLDADAKAKLARIIQSALQTQRLDMFHDVSEILNSSPKELLSNVNDKLLHDFVTKHDDDISDRDSIHNERIPVDLKKYIEMLLEREPGNPVEDQERKSSNNQKSSDCSRKPPWK